MPLVTKRHADTTTRELLRALIIVLNDVEALKIAYLASSPLGYSAAREKLAFALDSAAHKTKPLLDALDGADDRALLDLLAAWRGGLTY